MAASLKMKFLVAVVTGMVTLTVHAADEQLDDPTRPAVTLGSGSSGLEELSKPVALPPAGLQSVIISSKRQAAIINGTEVEVGHKYGDAVLTMVNETCVVLVGVQGRKVMHMFPAVNVTKNETDCVKRSATKPLEKAADTTVGAESAAESEKTKTNAATNATDDVKTHEINSATVEDKDGSVR